MNGRALALVPRGGSPGSGLWTDVVGRRWRGPSRPEPYVLVTGGAGFLGANIADRLAGEGHLVTVFDNLSRPGVEANLDWLRSRHGGRIGVMEADVRDMGAVEAAVAGAGAVLHLAAQVAVTTSLADPVADFEINARGTLNVLEAVRKRDEPPPVLFASTNKVYGSVLPANAVVPGPFHVEPRDPEHREGCDEMTPLDLHSPYGCSKGVADQYVRDYARVYGLRTLVFRMSCLYGPLQQGNEDQGWVAHFALSALRRRPVTLFGDGRQVRDILYVDDAVDAWLGGLGAIDRLQGQVFNLGGGPEQSTSLLELIDRLEALTGHRLVVRFDDWRAGDQRWYVSDIRALTAATGWTPKVGLDEGLTRLVEHLRCRLPDPIPASAVA
jgi:CDP-paratose 2-epimerase